MIRRRSLPDHSTKPVAVVTATIPITLDKFHRELIRQVQAEGYDVCVVSSPGPELTRIHEELGVRIHPLPMAREISVQADLYALVRWLRFCFQEQPTLVVSATPKASLLSQMAAKTTRAHRRLYYMGGLRLEGEQGRKRRVLTMIEKLTSWASTEVVANSRSLATRYAELQLAPRYKLRQTRPGSSHGVDSRHFAPQLPDMGLADELGIDLSIPVVGFVGRLTHDKGIDCLIRAIALLHADEVTCQLLVVGAQNEPDSAVYLGKLQSAGGRVITVGAVDDVRPYFGLMDVHVLPSLREGFPNVVLEASAMGLPTVTTDATGAIDSVQEGKTGLIVRTQDQRGLADAIKTLVRNPGMASRYGVAARNWVVADFQAEAVVQTLLAFGKVSGARALQHSREH